MKTSRLLSLSVCLVFLFVLPFSVQAKTTVTVAHTHVKSHPQHRAFLVFKTFVENRLGDKFEIKIYPNALSGPNERVFPMVKLNSIQFMAISASLLENSVKKYGFFSVPYLFESEQSYEKFLSDPELISVLSIDSKKERFRPLTAFTAGTRNFYANFPIRTADDLRGKNFRIQAGRTNSLMMEAFGANEYILHFEDVYGALKDGIVDGAENNELALVDQKHGEFCKYYSYDGHQMIPDMLIGSEAFLSNLSLYEYDVFMAAAKEAQRVEFREWKKSVSQAVEKAKSMGVTFIDVDESSFRKKVQHLDKQLIADNPAIKTLYNISLKYQPKSE